MNETRFIGKPDIKPLPYPYYFTTVVILALAGIADSIYLFVSHYLVHTDITYESFCAFTKAINCDTISQSRHSIFWGMPLAVWGIIGYSAFLILACFALDVKNEGKYIWNLLMATAFGFCLHSLALAYVSIFIIHAYCGMCILSYVINFFLLFFSWLTRRRFLKDGLISGFLSAFRFLARKSRVSVPACLSLFLTLALLQIFLPEYWQTGSPPFPENIHHGVTSHGHPWIGAKDPELVIVEFTDYFCFQCKKTHHLLRRILAKHPDKIRLVHRNFPMDYNFNPLLAEYVHPGAGKISLMAVRTSSMENFWKINDQLYEYGAKKSFDIRELAEKAGTDPNILANAIRNPVIRRRLKREVGEGIELGVKGTPTFLINGVLYESRIPPELIEKYWK